jgi:hypothetical protein
MTATSASDARYQLFLDEMSVDGNVARCCRLAKLDRSNVYQRRLKNEEFADAWRDAVETYTDRIEAEALRRAVDGFDRGVYHQGVLMATEKQYSDSLLALMLKAKRKEYRDNSKVELSGPEGGPLQVEQSPTEIARTIAFALALGLRNKEKQAEDGLDLA